MTLKHLLIFLFILMVMFSCKNRTYNLPARQSFSNNLIFPDTTYQLELTYIGMGCECPQWATEKHIKLYNNQSHKIPMDSIFVNIREEEGYVQNPFKLKPWVESDGTSNSFLFTGRISDNKFKWQGEDGKIWENKAFQYSKCKFVKK
ncbi:MAG: hypothetical protein ACI8YQ_003575 [Polaribacter sp.]|jgi:hypothetical protein